MFRKLGISTRKQPSTWPSQRISFVITAESPQQQFDETVLWSASVSEAQFMQMAQPDENGHDNLVRCIFGRPSLLCEEHSHRGPGTHNSTHQPSNDSLWSSTGYLGTPLIDEYELDDLHAYVLLLVRQRQDRSYVLDEVNVDMPDCLWERLQVRPKSLGTWPIGHQVIICGLIGAPENNGKKGKVAAYLPEKDRYKVRLDDKSTLAVKLRNMKVRGRAQYDTNQKMY